jgi:hypothetical protein
MQSAPRDRRRRPAVDLQQAPDPAPRLFSKAQQITIKFSNLTRDELDLLQTIVRELPSMVASIRAENNVERVGHLREANRLSDEIVNRLVADTWSMHHHHAELLKQIPAQDYSIVEERLEWEHWTLAFKLLRFSHNGRTTFPAFQFGPDGQPIPVIQEVVELFRRQTDYDDWTIAEWFTSPCRWLDQRVAPIVLLQSNAEAVREAARKEMTVTA